MARLHTDREYEAELESIREKVAEMGRKTESMIRTSIEACLMRNPDAAYEVIRQDDEIDRYEVAIDELCLNVIAKRQPLGPDLRFISTAQKIVTDIERMADLCVNISEKTIELGQQKASISDIDLRPMSDAVLSMVHDVIESFVASDAPNAGQIKLRDRTVDAYYAQIFRQLLEGMRQDYQVISQATRIQAVISNLERIGDHAKNIAEKIIYMVTGQDIRHKTRRGPGTSQSPRNVLFLCVQNSARSQMAEGWARHLFPMDIGVYSAGSNPAKIPHPMAVEAMKEAGIDISRQQTKKITDVPLGKIDMVISVCAEEVCVNLPGIIQRKAWSLPDPVAVSNEPSRKEAFCQVRDILHEKIAQLVSELGWDTQKDS